MAATASTPTIEELAGRLKSLESERDEYKQLYVSMLEAYRKLEAGLVGQKRERFTEGGEQTTLALLSMLTGQGAPAAPMATTRVEGHARVKPTGRKPLPDNLLASCQMQNIEPISYLRDLLCLIPSWSQQQLLDLAPASWSKTIARPDVQQQLEANVFRQVALGLRKPAA